MKSGRRIKLGEVLRIKHGFPFKGEHFTDKGQHILVTPGNFREEGGIKEKGVKEKFYSGPIPAEYVFRKGDVMVAMTDLIQAAPILGSAAIVPEDNKFLHNQRIGRVVDIDRHSVTDRFVYYLFNLDSVRAQIRASATGSTVRHTAPERIYAVEVLLPALDAQEKICGILSAYDDLVENCERRIRVLDEMTRALYREWFVHFRYPGHEQVPLVDSPLGRIPKGWEVAPLEGLKAPVPHAINGGPFGSKLVSRDYVELGVPVIRGSNLGEDGRFHPEHGFVFVTEEKAAELSANIARPGDIVVTQRGTLGQVGRIPHGIGHERFVISQSQMKVTLDEKLIDPEYGFAFLSAPEATSRIKNLASSSGVPHINLAVLREFKILLPPIALQRRFAALAQPAGATSEQLTRQAQNLRATRDLLLPRLLSGQLTP